MKEAVCKKCGDICEWLEYNIAYCHSCEKSYNLKDLIVNDIE